MVKSVELTSAQLKKLDPALRKACEVDATTRAAVANALSRGLDYSTINNYYKENSWLIEGLIVERNSDDNSVVPPSEGRAVSAMTNKADRELLTTEWQGYYRDRYTNNRNEARHDMIRLLCNKEVKKVQTAYSDLWRQTGFDPKNPEKRNASMRLRISYINGTPERQAEYQRKVDAYVEQHKNDLKDPTLIAAYRNAFAPKTLGDNIATNTRGTIEELTEADLRALAQFEVLNEMTKIGPGGMSEEDVAMACEEMAIDAITDRNINRGLVKVSEYKEQIRQIKQQYAKLPEIQQRTATYFSAKMQLEDLIEKETDPAKKAEYERNLADLTTQFEQDCFNALPKDAQKKISKLEKKIAEESKKAGDKENDFFNENIDELVELAAEVQVQIDIQKQKYDQRTKEAPAFSTLDKEVQEFVKLNPEDFGCRRVSAGETPDFESSATGEKVGYKFDFAKFQERMLYYSQRGRTSGEFQTNQEGCDYYCDLAEVDNCFKGVAFGGLGDDADVKRKLVKKSMEAAGITTEADRTAMQRMAHILKCAGIGAVTGALGVLAADGIAALKTCKFTENVYELAQLTGMIPVTLSDTVSLTGKFTKDYNLSGDDGTWGFHNDYHLSGDDASYSGEAFWSWDGEVNHEHNGILIETIPIHADGSIPYSGNDGHWTYDLVVDEHGNNAHWEYVHHVNEDVTLTDNVTLRGEVANPDANRELYEKGQEKTRKVRPKLSSAEVYGYAATAGAIAGAVKGAFDAHNIKDKGLRKEAEAMRVISQKDVRTTPHVDEDEGDGDDEVYPPEPEYEEEFCKYQIVEDVAPVAATPDEDVYNLKMNQKGNVIFWYQTADAYDIPEGLTARDVYWVIRELNGDPHHNKYAPDEVGLPKEITVKGKKVYRKDEFNIKGITYKPTGKGNGNGVGQTYVGKKGTPGREGEYSGRDCGGNVIQGGMTNAQAQQWIIDNPGKRTRKPKAD